MKLPDFTNFEPLNQLKSRMGIPADVYGSFLLSIDRNRLTVAELDLLTSGEGIDVSFDELTILPDGTLAYKDSRVLLYIRDVHVYGDRDREPRYHLSNCVTLQNMTESGRFDRYVVAAEVNGYFSLKIISNGRRSKERRKLCVCQNCLSELSFDGFRMQMERSARKRFVSEFTPDRFFAVYPRSLHVKKPAYNSHNAPVDDYPENWKHISDRVKQEIGWQCESPKCRRILSEPGLRPFLHVHHLGLRWDNRREMLKVLCIACHAEEPNHHHLKNDPRHAAYLRERPPSPP